MGANSAQPGMLKDANDRMALMQKLQRDPGAGALSDHSARIGAI